MRIGRLSVACWLVLAAFGGPVDANPESDLAEAKLQFEYKNFSQAKQLLLNLLYPNLRLKNKKQIVRAREMLGLCFFYLGDREKAHKEFSELLYIEPNHRLDPFLVPPPAVSFYDAIWKDANMRRRLRQIEKERQAQEEAKRKRRQSVVKRVYLERTQTESYRLIAFMPFGLGQYQNDHDGKFLFFAIAQGATLALNIGAWATLVGMESERGGFENLNLAQGLQITQYTSLAVFAGLWLWSVLDANYYFQPRATQPYKKMREEVDTPQSIGFFRLSPHIQPTGVGLTMNFDF